MKNSKRNHIIAHVLAIVTVFVWGITFVSSKILLEVYIPLEILLLRFSLAYMMLWIIHPKFYKVESFKERHCEHCLTKIWQQSLINT